MTSRPAVLSIAGLDPSGGAGILADIKTFEQHKVQGFGVCTALTYQTENKFLGLDWLSNKQLLDQFAPLFEQYDIKAVKIGLIQHAQLKFTLNHLPKNIPIIWDPVLNASAGFDFENELDFNTIQEILPFITLITPNLEEYASLELGNIKSTNVLLKGGHHNENKNDRLILTNGETHEIIGEKFTKAFNKHGTGCILSSAIASNLALGCTLEQACILAKKYVENILKSNDGLLAYHTN